MARPARLLASAAVGTLIALGPLAVASAQTSDPQSGPSPVPRTSAAEGAISGTVRDERGTPIPHAAAGPTRAVAVSDRSGRFELGLLPPGPYLLSARLPGYTARRTLTVQVSASVQTISAITLARGSTTPTILAAGIGSAPAPQNPPVETAAAVPGDDAPDRGAPESAGPTETAWRLRHARRSILKDLTVPADLQADGGDRSTPMVFAPVELLGRAVESPAHMATSLFADSEISGQVNLLTTGSFETPQELFSTDMLARNIAYVRVGAPIGDADWTARAAVNQADVSSWIAAGSYTSHSRAARHQYDIGVSYSTQRYDGGNVLTLRDVPAASRNVGTVYAFDTFKVTPVLAFAYGGAYARYDYLTDRNVLSPRAEARLTLADGLRVSASMSRQALAPGAEEFLPPAETGIWLPPQRTFSSLNAKGFTAEETTQSDVGLERDFGPTTVSVRAFRQHVDDQFVTVFGADMPGQPSASLGHYVVGNIGDVDANGCTAGVRSSFGSRLRGSVEYTTAKTDTTPARQVSYLLLVAPAVARPLNERLHDVSTTLETEVPETATRVLLLYRVGNGFVRPATASDAAAPGIDTRFDIQVRQSLPFLNFTSARWEMLLAVRNFFHEAGTEQSVLDERVTVRPPKRVVGGVTLRF
jgi:hypothetical protein